MTPKEELELSMLSMMLWKEARGEPDEGILAVAHTVIERIARPKWWSEPYHDVLSVIFSPYQYSSMTHIKDPQLFHFPGPTDSMYDKCHFIAEQVLSGITAHPAPGASHYFNPNTVFPPAWTTAATSRHIRDIGNHSFWFVYA